MGLADKNFSINQKLDIAEITGINKFSGGKPFAIKAVDGEGFITCQWGLKDFRYGLRGSDKNGCGWSAAYNLLKILGETPCPAEIARQFEKYRVLFGVLGTTAFAFYPYFHRKGYQVQPVLTWNISKLEKKILAGKGAVLFYLHPKWFKGGHFVAVQGAKDKDNPQKLIFYNALNRPLKETKRKIGEISVYRQEFVKDVRTLKEFVEDEKAYYKVKHFPSPFYGICVSSVKAEKPSSKYSYQKIF